jgi:hypothetical protein
MAEFEIVDKVGAVQRQLETAIWMFFERKDPIAIHSLGWAAYQILIDLCQIKGIEREIEDSAILKEMGKLNEVITAMRKPHNFFKHSDKDPDSTVKFFPDSNYPLLLMASQYFFKLTGNVLFEGQILRMWFCMKHPDRAPPEWEAGLNKVSKTINWNDYEFFLEVLNKNKAK